jgi:HK97 gp10 family phage protein
MSGKKYTMPQFIDALNRMSNEVKRNTMKRAATAGALVIETAAKVSMSASSHSGIQYGNHRASAAGETPAVDTGVLVNSISTWVDSQNGEQITMGIGSGIVYAARLEFGFMEVDSLGRKYNQEPRPYMRPAVDNNEDKIMQAISTTLKRDIEGMI